MDSWVYGRTRAFRFENASLTRFQVLPIQFVLEKDLFQSITVKIVVIRLTDCLIAGAATFIQPFEVLESGDPLERLRVCAAGCGEPDSGETRTRIRD